MQNPPMKTKKKCLCFFAPCAFWRCSTGLFAFVPLDLNFTNPKSTIFEPGRKTQPFPANHDQITKYNLMFFFIKNKIKLDWLILCRNRQKKKWKQNSQLSHTFLAAKQNHNKSNHKNKKNENFYRKNRGQWSLRYTLHFLLIGIEARISTLWLTCGKMGFWGRWQNDFWSREEKKKTGRGNGFILRVKKCHRIGIIFQYMIF